jgi:hypothetical protein
MADIQAPTLQEAMAARESQPPAAAAAPAPSQSSVQPTLQEAVTAHNDPFTAVGGKAHIDSNNMIGPQPTLGQQFKWDPGTPLRTAIRNIENYTEEGRKEHPALSTVGDALKRIYEPAAEVPHDVEHPLAQPVPPPLPGFSAALEGGAADVAAANTAVAARPVATASLASKITKGAKVAQQPAKEALTEAAGAVSKAPNVETSLPHILEQPIDETESQYKSLYAKIDQAAGTDIKELRKKLSNTEYQIRNLTDTEADQALEGKLEESRRGLIDKIEQAKQDAIAKGVDPKTLDQADAAYGKAQALQEVEKVLKNPSNIIGNARVGQEESINVDSTIRALQKLQYSDKFSGSRLEQALGEQASNALLGKLYEAQRLGQSAIKARVVAEWITGGIAGVATVADAAKHLMPGK